MRVLIPQLKLIFSVYVRFNYLCVQKVPLKHHWVVQISDQVCLELKISVLKTRRPRDDVSTVLSGTFYKKKGSWFKPIGVQVNECLCNLAQLEGCQWLVFLVGSAVVLPKN